MRSISACHRARSLGVSFSRVLRSSLAARKALAAKCLNCRRAVASASSRRKSRRASAVTSRERILNEIGLTIRAACHGRRLRGVTQLLFLLTIFLLEQGYERFSEQSAERGVNSGLVGDLVFP